ncbi:MAG: response regulator [Rivularia sp. (in: cyanobacteria)]
MDKDNLFAVNLPLLQGLRVLVVDKSVDCCDLLELQLGLYGVEVRKAFLAQEAVKIFLEWQPDILVSNIGLAEVDGFTLAQQIRTIAAERRQALLIVATTTYISEEMRQYALSNVFDLWFTKPLDINHFLTVLAYSMISYNPPLVKVF